MYICVHRLSGPVVGLSFYGTNGEPIDVENTHQPIIIRIPVPAHVVHNNNDLGE